MTRQNLDLKAGELIVFSEGEYSDYGYQGAFVVLKDAKSDDLLAMAREIQAKEDEELDWARKPDIFVSAVIREGYLAAIDLREIHLGAYGDLTIGGEE